MSITYDANKTITCNAKAMTDDLIFIQHFAD